MSCLILFCCFVSYVAVCVYHFEFLLRLRNTSLYEVLAGDLGVPHFKRLVVERQLELLFHQLLGHLGVALAVDIVKEEHGPQLRHVLLSEARAAARLHEVVALDAPPAPHVKRQREHPALQVVQTRNVRQPLFELELGQHQRQTQVLHRLVRAAPLRHQLAVRSLRPKHIQNVARLVQLARRAPPVDDHHDALVPVLALCDALLAIILSYLLTSH